MTNPNRFPNRFALHPFHLYRDGKLDGPMFFDENIRNRPNTS